MLHPRRPARAAVFPAPRRARNPQPSQAGAAGTPHAGGVAGWFGKPAGGATADAAPHTTKTAAGAPTPTRTGWGNDEGPAPPDKGKAPQGAAADAPRDCAPRGGTKATTSTQRADDAGRARGGRRGRDGMGGWAPLKTNDDEAPQCRHALPHEPAPARRVGEGRSAERRPFAHISTLTSCPVYGTLVPE